MTYHYTDKVGFTIRYGGPEGIQWLKSGPAEGSATGLSPTGLAGGPAGMVIEAAKAAGLFLQWWEMRKQTILQTAQFEERRLQWLLDMFLLWSSEVASGQVRLDTVVYFNRELTRLLEKIKENDLIDAPSSLLLQMERCAHAMAGINQFLSVQLKTNQGRFLVPGRALPRLLSYTPSWKIAQNSSSVEGYLGQIDQALKFLPNGNSGIMKLIPSFPFWLLSPVATGLAMWGHSLWADAQKQATKQRLAQFQSLTNLALELRSMQTQLAFAALLPETVETLPMEDPILALTNGGAAFQHPEQPVLPAAG
jgi:hypothetical protein